MCGTLDYIVTYDGEEIGEESTPIAFKNSNREFSIFTEDDLDVGAHEVTIIAFLTDYPEIKSSVAAISLEIVDVCPNPFSVIAPNQNNPSPYFYSANQPELKFTLKPFYVDPTVCSPSYSCRVISGVRTDLCSV